VLRDEGLVQSMVARDQLSVTLGLLRTRPIPRQRWLARIAELIPSGSMQEMSGLSAHGTWDALEPLIVPRVVELANLMAAAGQESSRRFLE
jgi:hypothetical protein